MGHPSAVHCAGDDGSRHHAQAASDFGVMRWTRGSIHVEAFSDRSPMIDTSAQMSPEAIKP
jgi:hypothetical protein